MKWKVFPAALLFPAALFAQGTPSILKCSLNAGVEVHSGRESSSPVIARVACGSPVLLIDTRFGSPHIRTEDGKDGFITGLNFGQWAIEPEAGAAPPAQQLPATSHPITPTAPQVAPQIAQASRVEVFGGFALLQPKVPSSIAGEDVAKAAQFIIGNVLGWGASAAVYLRPKFGIEGDFGGHYRRTGDIQIDSADHGSASANLHTFLGGPIFKGRKEHFEPFAHALFGIGRVAASSTITQNNQTTRDSFSDTGFVMAIGGGIDVPITSAIRLRPIEADYFPYRTSPDDSAFTFNNIRWRTGVVFKF
jgi:hypothetical protein